MKKIIVSILILCGLFGFSFGQDFEIDLGLDEAVQTITSALDDMLFTFFFEIGAQMQTSVETHKNTYLSGYCTTIDLFNGETEDTLDCGKYQATARVLDSILENIVPDLEAIMEFDVTDETSIEEVQMMLEQARFQVTQEVTKIDTLSTIMSKALEKPGLSDTQQFGIRYILFAFATIKDIINLLPDFLQNMIDYTSSIREGVESLIN